MLSWVILSLLAAICWAVVNVNDKYILSGLNIPARVAMIGTGVVGLISAFVVAIVKGVVLLPLWNASLGLLAGVCFMLMIIFYLEAAKREEISRIIPLFNLSPLFILFFAYFFLKEALTVGQYTGIFAL